MEPLEAYQSVKETPASPADRISVCPYLAILEEENEPINPSPQDKRTRPARFSDETTHRSQLHARGHQQVVIMRPGDSLVGAWLV